MAIQLIHNFKIKPVDSKKNKRKQSVGTKVSRLCTATVIEEDGELMAYVSLRNNPDFPDYVCMPFTQSSFDLKGRQYVFSKKKDEYGHYICTIKNEYDAKYHPASHITYTTLVPKLIVGGYVYRINGKLHFEYNDIVAFGSHTKPFNPIKLDLDKQIFLK